MSNNLLGNLLSLIERLAKDGTLANAPFYWDIVRSWKLIGDGERAKAWVSAGMESSANFLVKALKGFVQYTVSSSPRDYSLSERPDEDLYDLNVMLKACKKHLEGQELDADGRNMVSAVTEALEQMLSRPVSEDTVN